MVAAKLLLAAGALCLSGASAQTILSDDGVAIEANEITVAPAGEVVSDGTRAPSDPAATLLTDAVLGNLTDRELSNIELFAFDATPEVTKRAKSQQCKTFPGDALWPTRTIWKVFNLLTGNALIETVPIGAVCYEGTPAYDEAKCADVLARWAQSGLHAEDPTSVMSPIYQGETCMPQNGANSSRTCELGGYPTYVVKIDNVAQIQLAVNFARNLGIRLVVKNTGHDFLGKSAGAGALSIWTHHLKTIQYLESVSTASYSGPAIKLGAGVQVAELYEAASKLGVTAVGGECPGVGVSGGYIAGGGHSPMSSKYGLGADQVLSIDVVLPNGRFVTASEEQNTDLFWALRGGGGATFGVVTGLTVKVYPKMKFSGMKFTVMTGPAGGDVISDSVFWDAMFAYWRKFPGFAEQGSYGYSTLFPVGPGSYMWSMLPWMVPGMSLVEFQDMVGSLLAEWALLGFEPEITWFEEDEFLDAWTQHFPVESVANSNMRTTSRLFPASAWEDVETREAMFEAVKSVIVDGSALIQYNIRAPSPSGTPAAAANSHWREAAWFGIMGGGWDASVTTEELEFYNRRITEDWMGRLRPYGPGAYGNEGDVMEPDFGEAFFGENYPRLLEIKRAVDPLDVFWAPTAVGSERWKVQDQFEWLTTQTGQLCRA